MKRLTIFLLTAMLVACASSAAFAEFDAKWDDRYTHEQRFIFKGAGAMSGTLDNAAAVDGTTYVRFPATGHGLLAGSYVYLSGTTNYDGLWPISAVAANTFDILVTHVTYVAETFAGTETWGAAIKMPNTLNRIAVPYQLVDVRVHLSAASATSENLTATLDAENGSQFDVVLLTQNMNTVADLVWTPENPHWFLDGDVIKFAWTNTNARTWGLEVVLRVQAK